MEQQTGNILILGIGNILYGDEGIGVYAIEHLKNHFTLPENVELLDGGTGSFYLLGPMQAARTVLLIDATMDDRPPGTITRLTPRFTAEYPPTLTAHDIGLKDLLDAFYLSGNAPRIILYAVSIGGLAPGLEINLSKELTEILPDLCNQVYGEAQFLSETIELD